MPKKFSGLCAILVQSGSRVAIVPICHVCKKPILNFEDGNILFECPADSRPGEVLTVHKTCDPRPRDWGWTPLDSVFREDQRSKRDEAFGA